jgi:REP element-mobilizing transposase RayT
MKYDPAKHHRRSIRLKGFDYTTSGAYFITICTHHRECLFGEIVDGIMQLNALGQIAQRHWLKLPNHHRHLSLDKFVIMPDHMHGILVLHDAPVGAGFDGTVSELTTNGLHKPAPTSRHDGDRAGFDGTGSELTTNGVHKPAAAEHHDCDWAGFDNTGSELTTNVSPKPAPTSRHDCDNTMPELTANGSYKPAPTPASTKRHGVSEIIRGFKTFSARRINQMRRSPGIPVWQRNFYERIIRDDEAMQRIRRYIQANPSSWQRGKACDESQRLWRQRW